MLMCRAGRQKIRLYNILFYVVWQYSEMGIRVCNLRLDLRLNHKRLETWLGLTLILCHFILSSVFTLHMHVATTLHLCRFWYHLAMTPLSKVQSKKLWICQVFCLTLRMLDQWSQSIRTSQSLGDKLILA